MHSHLIADSLCILPNLVLFRFVDSAVIQPGLPYLSIDIIMLARSRLLLLRGPSEFGIILAIAAWTFTAFSQTWSI